MGQYEVIKGHEEYDGLGYTFGTGQKATEDKGLQVPTLRQLQYNIVKMEVSIEGLEKEVVWLTNQIAEIKG